MDVSSIAKILLFLFENVLIRVVSTWSAPHCISSCGRLLNCCLLAQLLFFNLCFLSLTGYTKATRPKWSVNVVKGPIFSRQCESDSGRTSQSIIICISIRELAINCDILILSSGAKSHRFWRDDRNAWPWVKVRIPEPVVSFSFSRKENRRH